jgi:uncharacterized protein YuzE
MRVEYDQQADALYIMLAERAEVARTVQIDPGTLVDLDDRGCLIGVEVIRPARPWPLDEILSRFPIDGVDERLLRLCERATGAAGTFTYAEPVQLVRG